VTYGAANAALQPVVEQFASEMPKHFPEHFKVKVEALNAWAFRRVGGTVYAMFAAVMLLLVIGCGNVSILLLAQGTARQHELAVRAAIGAARARIMRQLLSESLLLAAIGAALGIWMSYAMLAGIRLLLPPYAFPAEAVIRINRAGNGHAFWNMASTATVAHAGRPNHAIQRASHDCRCAVAPNT
jgi:predicted lysophospholipase L1 biosynthesis ABC-type transport system permease subunit